MRVASPAISPALAQARPAAVPRDVSLGYLRAFVTVLVVLHHAVLGYAGMPPSASFTDGPMLWRAFPITDIAHPWPFAMVIAGFNDIYFMSLMFLLSGLFVDASVARKGIGAFVRDRMLRLGIPFLFAALLIAPISYFFSWLQTGGAADVSAYAAAWTSMGDWPTGPAWFILMLLVFDLVIAGVYALSSRWTDALAALAAGAARRPFLSLLTIMAAAFAVYAPLSLTFGPDSWFSEGPVQFQISRAGLYFLFFLMGIGLGTYGLGKGLLARDGWLARRWWLWLTIVSPLAFIGGFIGLTTLMSGQGDPATLIPLLTLSFVVGCVSSSFGLLGLFTRFVHAANPVWESLSRHAYGIYIVHYAFVAGLQYALLPAGMDGWMKAALVTVGALGLSWATAAVLRRMPVASRLVGE